MSCPVTGRRRRVDHRLPRGVALLLVASLASALTGCGWFGIGSSDPPAAAVSTAREIVSLPEGTNPGKLELIFKNGDYTAADLVLPAGKYQIDVYNINDERDIGFFLRLPDQYGREINHLASGGAIRIGAVRSFDVAFDAGRTYVYNCPITGSPNHLISAVPPKRPPAAESSPVPPAAEPAPSESQPPADTPIAVSELDLPDEQ